MGPTLGQDSINRSIIAGIIGLLAVAFFMIVFYRLPGVLAVLALAVYSILTFALFKLFGIVLTLAGIAGFILSIGMAVDANVLIFARMKEELRAGRSLRNAIDAGFDHAWPSIRDSNVSTTITCLILYVFGGITGDDGGARLLAHAADRRARVAVFRDHGDAHLPTAAPVESRYHPQPLAVQRRDVRRAGAGAGNRGLVGSRQSAVTRKNFAAVWQ